MIISRNPYTTRPPIPECSGAARDWLDETEVDDPPGKSVPTRDYFLRFGVSVERLATIKASLRQIERPLTGFAANVLPVIHQIQASGVQSLRGVPAGVDRSWRQDGARGEWSAVQVADILRRQ
jgi:hypothetical protein